MSVLNSLANPSQRWTVPVKGCTLISPKMVIPSFSPTVKWSQITNGSTRTQNHASSNLSLHSGITLPISQLTVQSKVSPAHWLTPTIFHLAPHRAINYLPLEDHMECPKYKQKKSNQSMLSSGYFSPENCVWLLQEFYFLNGPIWPVFFF